MNRGMSWTRRYLLPIWLLFTALHAPTIFATDCAAAKSKIDKAICSIYGLNGQGTDLDESYRAAMKKLSPEAQSALRTDQMNWSQYVTKACRFAEDDSKPGGMHCLYEQFERRRALLSMTTREQTLPRYVFYARSTYETSPDPSGHLPFWSESSIPQIDRQSLSAGIAWSDAEAWNNLIAKRIGGPEKSSVCPGGKGEIYKVPYVNATSGLLLSVTVGRDDECHLSRPDLILLRRQGPSNNLPQDHFMSETQYNIVMMRGDVHELKPTDLFLSGQDWKILLTERVEQEVKKQAHDHGYNWQPSAGAMRRVATDPSNWILGSDSFAIRVNQAALSADEFIGSFTVAIPWSDLQHVLSFKGHRILSARNG